MNQKSPAVSFGAAVNDRDGLFVIFLHWTRGLELQTRINILSNPSLRDSEES